MTLDGYALTGLFVVMFGFLAFSAWVFERAEPDPISGDRRMARPMAGPLCRWCGEAKSEHGPAYGKAVYGGQRGCEWDMQTMFFTPFDAPSGRSTTEPVPPVPGSAGLDRPLGLSRGNQSVVPD